MPWHCVNQRHRAASRREAEPARARRWRYSVGVMANIRPSGARWVVDPKDPRAPPTEIWREMSPEERAAVVASLPADPAVDFGPPEGDDHYDAADGPRKTLRRFFDRLGRRAYVGTNMSVYYPDEPVFAPDLFVVLDVEPKKRSTWIVADEGKGLDFVLEVHVRGNWRKDFVTNVTRYARLGIREYFAFNFGSGVLVGHRLGKSGTVYEPLAAGATGFASAVLGLDLLVEGNRVRFFNAGAPLPELDELVGRLETAMVDTLSRLSGLERDLEQERAALEQERAAREQADARVAALEAELAALRAKR
jgi:hypothetical protein